MQSPSPHEPPRALLIDQRRSMDDSGEGGTALEELGLGHVGGEGTSLAVFGRGLGHARGREAVGWLGEPWCAGADGTAEGLECAGRGAQRGEHRRVGWEEGDLRASSFKLRVVFETLATVIIAYSGD